MDSKLMLLVFVGLLSLAYSYPTGDNTLDLLKRLLVELEGNERDLDREGRNEPYRTYSGTPTSVILSIQRSKSEESEDGEFKVQVCEGTADACTNFNDAQGSSFEKFGDMKENINGREFPGMVEITGLTGGKTYAFRTVYKYNGQEKVSTGKLSYTTANES